MEFSRTNKIKYKLNLFIFDKNGAGFFTDDPEFSGYHCIWSKMTPSPGIIMI